ncbi:hypothetical protein C0989_010592 [Termitomyces sp. Mn162]|nr:hypothetical protein C0989_010592 [Termitomyces sp. Mn162]
MMSKSAAPQTTWNIYSNTNWQARATNSSQPSIPAAPTNSALCFSSRQGPLSTNQPPGPHPPAQLKAANLHKASELLDINPDNSQDPDNALDPAEDQEAYTQIKSETDLELTYWRRCRKNERKRACVSYVDALKEVSGLGHKGTLNCGSDTNVFSALVVSLHNMVFSPDTLSAHLSLHSSHTLLLHTTLPFSANSIPTLVDSGATNNFINELLAALAPQCLQQLPTPILFKLFDGDPTSAGDITHCVETTMTFVNG